MSHPCQAPGALHFLLKPKGTQHVAAQAVMNTNALISGRSLVFICKMEAKLLLTFRAKSKG